MTSRRFRPKIYRAAFRSYYIFVAKAQLELCEILQHTTHQSAMWIMLALLFSGLKLRYSISLYYIVCRIQERPGVVGNMGKERSCFTRRILYSYRNPSEECVYLKHTYKLSLTWKPTGKIVEYFPLAAQWRSLSRSWNSFFAPYSSAPKIYFLCASKKKPSVDSSQLQPC